MSRTLSPAAVLAYARRRNLTHIAEEARAARQATRSGLAAEATLAAQLRQAGLEVVQQFAWGQLLTPPTQHRADLYLPAHTFIVEVVGGAHRASVDRLNKDSHRDNLLDDLRVILPGLRVKKYPPAQARDGSALASILTHLQTQEARHA